MDLDGNLSSNTPELLSIILDKDLSWLSETTLSKRKDLINLMEKHCNEETKLHSSRWLFPDSFSIDSICSN